MFRYSALRIIVLLCYFTLCSACGRPSIKTAGVSEGSRSTSNASDINYIGGGNQAPTPAAPEGPYKSPMTGGGADRTSLTWVSDDNTAIRLAARNDNYRIILWFRNDNCVDCQGIERDVFGDLEVAKNADDWLFVKMDTSQNADRAEYYLHGGDPPALVFLDNGGHEYHRYNGVFTKAEFITMLKTYR